MSFVVPAVFKAIDDITAPMRTMRNSVKGFSDFTVNAMHRVDRAAIGLGRRINAVTGGFGLMLGSALAFQQAQAAINTMADFEQGLVAVGKTADIRGPDLTQFGKSIIGVSRSLDSVIGTPKLLELGAVAGTLGVKGSENITKFSQTLAKLEKATDLVGEQGAKSIARILNVTGEGVGVVEQFGSAITALGNNLAASESEILAVANEVARSTAPFGLASHEVLGISGALKSLGVQSEAGGTAVGKLFKEMEAAVATGKNLQGFSKILGLSGDQIVKQFKDRPAQLFVPFVQGLQRIVQSGQSVGLALKDVGIGGEIAFKVLAPLATRADLVARSMGISSEEFTKNIALQKEFAAASRTIRSAMAAVVNEFQNIINSTANANNGFSLVANTLFFVKDNLGLVIKGVVGLGIAYLGLKAATIIINAVTWAYNAALAVNAIIQGKTAFALRGHAKALKIFTFFSKIATAAQWLWNAALTANPIGLVIAAIAALIAVIVLVIAKWEDWGAALSLVLGPLGLIISIIQSIRKNWDLVSQAFTTGGIINALKAIGLTLVDAVLMPMEQILGIFAKIPGFAKGFEQIQGARMVLQRQMEILAGNPQTAAIAPATQAAPVAPIDPININQQDQQFNNETNGYLQEISNKLDNRADVNVNIQNEEGEIVDAPDTDIPISTPRGFDF